MDSSSDYNVNFNELTSTTHITVLSPPCEHKVLHTVRYYTPNPVAARPGPIPARPCLALEPTGVPAQPPSCKLPLLFAPAPTKKRATFPTENYGIPEKLGECTGQDVERLQCVGWPAFIKILQNGGNLPDLTNVENHPAKLLLRHYKNSGVPRISSGLYM